MGGLFGLKGCDLALDLGTANVRIATSAAGVILSEPSAVAISGETGKILAAGTEAKRMVGRTPGNVRTRHPIQGGVITNAETARMMLHHFLRSVRSGHGKPRVRLPVPAGITDVEREAIEYAVLRAGARRVEFVEAPIAAAIGANVAVAEPTASMVADIGAGTTNVAVLSLGGIVTSTSLKIGGDDLDQAIVRHIRKVHGLLIGDRLAEEIKLTVGSAVPGAAGSTAMLLHGKDGATGMPCSISIQAEEMLAPLLEPLGAIVEVVKSALDGCPPALVGDLVSRGITITGGGALLPGFERLLRQEIGVPVRMAADPFGSVVLGAARTIPGRSEAAQTEALIAPATTLQLGPALAVGEIEAPSRDTGPFG